MKKFLCILFVSLCVHAVAFPQQPEVDYAEIQNSLRQEGIYEELMERYAAFDTTLTQEDYIKIYYGFSFQDAYLDAPAYISIDGVEEQLSVYNFNAAVEECQKILSRNPVSLYANNMIAFAYYNMSDSLCYKYTRRLSNLFNAILMSGDGRTEATAFKVIFVSDEYEVMNYVFNIEHPLSQTLTGTCDKFNVEPNERFDAPFIYFDISRSLKQLEHSILKNIKRE